MASRYTKNLKILCRGLVLKLRKIFTESPGNHKIQEGRIIYSFGEFELDPDNRCIAVSGKEIRCSSKAFDLLVLLVSNAGALVTRDDIKEKLWGGRTVEFDQAINNCIRSLRLLLDDNVKSPTYIKTVPKYGYVFVHDISTHLGAKNVFRPRLAHVGAVSFVVLLCAAILPAFFFA